MWGRTALAVRPRTAWTVGGTTHPAGVLLGIGLDRFLAGARDFRVLAAPAERQSIQGFFFAGPLLLVEMLDDLHPDPLVVAPEEAWAIRGLAGLPRDGVVTIWRLDEEESESDGSLLALTQDPLTPPTLMSADARLAAPTMLKRAPAVFDPAGLVVTRHEALSADGERIPYVRWGRPARPGTRRCTSTAMAGSRCRNCHTTGPGSASCGWSAAARGWWRISAAAASSGRPGTTPAGARARPPATMISPPSPATWCAAA